MKQVLLFSAASLSRIYLHACKTYISIYHKTILSIQRFITSKTVTIFIASTQNTFSASPFIIKITELNQCSTESSFSPFTELVLLFSSQ